VLSSFPPPFLDKIITRQGEHKEHWISEMPENGGD
jgi:hypothetical protein